MPATLPFLNLRLGAALLLAGGLLAARPAQAQWVTQNSNLPIYYGVNNISIADANTAWATSMDFSSNNPNGTNPNNTYIRTTNGGTTWATGTIPDAASLALVGVAAASAQVAWAACDNLSSSSGGGRIYYTSNGGASWTRQLTTGFSGSAGFVNGVVAFSATQAVAAGDPNPGSNFEIYYTTNAGTTWTAATTPTRLSSSEYGLVNTVVTVPGTNAAARSCWMGTAAGRVLRSSDSGMTWAASATGLSAVSALAFSTATNGIAVDGQSGSLAYTADGGATWVLRTPTGAFYANTISGVPGYARVFVSAGLANGGSTYGSSYSNDGGQTWTAIDSQLHYTVAFLNGTVGYSGGISSGTGTDGIFKGTLPAAALATTPARPLTGLSVYPNPATDAFTVAVPAVADAARVQATLYNALGQPVARQVVALPAAGTQLNFGTAGLAAGLYTLRVQAGETVASQPVSIR